MPYKATTKALWTCADCGGPTSSRHTVRCRVCSDQRRASSRQPAGSTPPNPAGLCLCGCGRVTPIAKRSDYKDGIVRGEHVRYLTGHNPKTNLTGQKPCRACGLVFAFEVFGRYERNGVVRAVCPDCHAKWSERRVVLLDVNGNPEPIPIDHIAADFGNWLAGFVDGEGSFVIVHDDPGHRCALTLTLRRDDEAIVREIVGKTGLGSFHLRSRPHERGNTHPQVNWTVTSKKDCLALTQIFDRFPLRAKKRRDYEIWRKAVLLWARMPHRNGSTGPGEWSEMAALKDALVAVRRYQSPDETA